MELSHFVHVVSVHTQASDLRAASNNWQLIQEELLLSYLPSKLWSRTFVAVFSLVVFKHTAARHYDAEKGHSCGGVLFTSTVSVERELMTYTCLCVGV